MTDRNVDDVRGEAKEAIADLAEDDNDSLKDAAKGDQGTDSVKERVEDAADKVKDAVRRD